MTDLRKAAEMAFDALNEVTGWQWAGPMRVMDEVEDAIEALRQALAHGEQDTNEVCKKLCAQARRSERGACHQIIWDYGFSRIDNEEVQAACVHLAQAIRGRGKHE